MGQAGDNYGESVHVPSYCTRDTCENQNRYYCDGIRSNNACLPKSLTNDSINHCGDHCDEMDSIEPENLWKCHADNVYACEYYLKFPVTTSRAYVQEYEKRYPSFVKLESVC